MANTTINIRMDKDLKKKFDVICNEMGLNMTSAVNVFAKAVVHERAIPFLITAGDPFYSQSNMEVLDRSIQQVKEKRVITKTMEELETMAND